VETYTRQRTPGQRALPALRHVSGSTCLSGCPDPQSHPRAAVKEDHDRLA
jgi:hypothetical protein